MSKMPKFPSVCFGNLVENSRGDQYIWNFSYIWFQVEKADLDVHLKLTLDLKHMNRTNIAILGKKLFSIQNACKKGGQRE